ncbi:MAG TPA: hypothetical protein VN282_27800 [Pyrinomonadaceae bacterium]|nr:hypothetical protein [Pyrinomonadaceae bacterium]
MRNRIAVIGLGALVVLQGCVAKGDPVSGLVKSPAHATSDGISREKALEVANREMLMAGQGRARRKVASCKLSLGWLLIYDDGLELVIGNSGQTLARRYIPLGTQPGEVLTASAGNTAIDEKTAVKITERDAAEVYHSAEKFKVTTCELPAVWRVVYEFSRNASGGGPDYVVDKRDGQIIYKRYNQ